MKILLMIFAIILFSFSQLSYSQSKVNLKPAGKSKSDKFWVSKFIGGSASGVARKIHKNLYLNDKPFTMSQGFCYLTVVGGTWNGLADYAKFEITEYGEWVFNYGSGGSKNYAGGVCIVYH